MYGIVILMFLIVGLVAVGFFFPLLWILAGALVVLGVAWWIMATRRAAGERDLA